ncbi:MAG: hypothetical protein ACREIE_08070, partial [Nitrospiraceae bacterium]
DSARSHTLTFPELFSRMRIITPETLRAFAQSYQRVPAEFIELSFSAAEASLGAYAELYSAATVSLPRATGLVLPTCRNFSKILERAPACWNRPRNPNKLI